MTSIILRAATLSSGQRSDILIENGVITELGKVTAKASVQHDCDGLLALPGFVDLHAHLREPGFESSETIATGSRAAAAGGFTAVHAMANTNPVADNASVVEQIYRIGREVGLVEVRPVGAITKNLEGTSLAEMGQMAASRARVALFSDDGKCVSDSLLMRRALEYAKTFSVLVAQHAQDPRLTVGAQLNEGEVSTRLGLAPWPSVAEESIIARDVLLAEAVGTRIHICHVSTAGSVEVIRWAKARGIMVSAEATPHHLLLTETMAEGYDPIFKVNPPLRTKEDVMALRSALIDGTIDVIATDHAPHGKDSKSCEWQEAAFGMLGLEAAARVAQEVLIESGESDWQRLAEVMSSRPASLVGLKGQGEPIAIGSRANLTLLDPTVRRLSRQSHSKSDNDPYVAVELPGEIRHTIFNGRFSYLDGSIVERAQEVTEEFS